MPKKAPQRRSPIVRALGTGLFSTLLPCGWLYAFVVTAAGTGSWALGAATMAAFWVGTLPILAVIGVGVRRLAGPLRRYVPAVTALVLVAVGLMTVAGRLSVPAIAADDSGAPPSVEAAVARASEIGSEEPLCHQTGE